MKQVCRFATVKGMIEHFGDRAAAEATTFAADAAMIGDVAGVILWLEVAGQIRTSSSLTAQATVPGAW